MKYANLFVPIALMFLLTLNSAWTKAQSLTLGADRLEELNSASAGKRLALVANQSSLSGEKHLIDILVENGQDLQKLFALEHGIRGKAEAGALIKDGRDTKTGLEIVSLYGKNKKPSSDHLKGIDAVIFDIQDVGARFYTYLSSMHYIMEACAENEVEFIVLDRPNPNGHIVDGPVLSMEYQSFVGMHAIPILHGMTLAELAKMIKGESLINNAQHLQLRIVEMLHYSRFLKYEPPVLPSPNLPNYRSILLYPGLCLFEGTSISVGRGTDFPFQVYGAPCLSSPYTFKPTSIPGKSLHPKHENEQCNGVNLQSVDIDSLRKVAKLNIECLIEAFENCDAELSFFNSFFDKLAGTDALRKSILQGMTAKEIRASWEKDLNAFRLLRSKYLIYPEYE